MISIIMSQKRNTCTDTSQFLLGRHFRSNCYPQNKHKQRRRMKKIYSQVYLYNSGCSLFEWPQLPSLPCIHVCLWFWQVTVGSPAENKDCTPHVESSASKLYPSDSSPPSLRGKEIQSIIFIEYLLLYWALLLIQLLGQRNKTRPLYSVWKKNALEFFTFL